MRYLIIAILLLSCGKAKDSWPPPETKPVDPFSDYYGLYVGYKMESGSSVHAPRCREELTPDNARFLIKNNGMYGPSIQEPFNEEGGTLVASLIDKDDDLNLIYDATTKEDYHVFRHIRLIPYKDETGKLTGEVEIAGVVYGLDKEGFLKCWSSWVTSYPFLGHFDHRDK